MSLRISRGWLAFLLTFVAIRYRRSYVGTHRPEAIEARGEVSQTYHPDHSGPFSILDSPNRLHELWLARFDERDESEYLSAALMRAPLNALSTVIDHIRAERMSDWKWLKYSTDEFPRVWRREMEILNGRDLLPA